MKRIATIKRILLISEEVSGDISWYGGGFDWLFELLVLFGFG